MAEDFKDLYKDTFSHVRSSCTVNLEDFEKMKTNKKTPVRKIVLIAAAVAVLAALGVTASATGFFGLARVADPESGVITAQGYADSAESRAYMESVNTGISLREAAEKYGLTYVDRCEVYTYEEMAKLQGGDLTDMRSSRNAFIVYEDGSYSTDTHFSRGGKTIGYSLHRSVKGSLTQMEINASWLGEEHTEWSIKVGDYDVCLVLGSGSRSLILADLGNGFFTVLVYAGEEADEVLSTGSVTRDDLEALAKSFNWSLISKIVVPNLPPVQEVQFGAGVELDPENIVEDQSFLVELPGWGEVHFITYRPTPEFNTARFFLSRDGKVSDYEFHTVYEENWTDTAAVCFTDLTGDGETDVLILNDYLNDYTGQAERQVRIYSYAGGGEYKWEEELSFNVRWAIDNEKLTVDAVLDFLKVGGGQDTEGADKYGCYLEVLSHPSVQGYALFDFKTGDGGAVELITYDGGKWSFWTAQDGRAVWLADVDAYKTSLHIKPETGTLWLFSSNMSGATLTDIYWDGGTVAMRDAAAWEWREGVETPDIGDELPFYEPSRTAPVQDLG